MGNISGSYEISIDEQEQFEMQVDEEYNPNGMQSENEAKLEYLQRQRVREAEEFRNKYLGVAAAPKNEQDLNPNINVIRNTVVVQH